MRSYIRRKPAWIASVGVILLVLLTNYLYHYVNITKNDQLEEVEHSLNELYRSYHPFLYRWSGAPCISGIGDTQKIPEKLLGKEVARVDQWELFRGRTAFSVHLLGRIDLLAGQYEHAVDLYRSGSVRFPADNNLQAELAISLAMRAQNEHRGLDYERALETVLSIKPAAVSSEVLFNTALVFEQVPLPKQAIQRWQQAIAKETSSECRGVEKSRLADLEHRLETRDNRIHNLIDSPSSYLAHADEANGSLEFVLEAAIANWLPSAASSATDAQALGRLAAALSVQHHDAWLSDLLDATHSAPAALNALSKAWKANNEGYHARAERLAILAETLFGQANNLAGLLRSRVEQVYALDRLQRPTQCMKALSGLRLAAHARHYVWIEGQSWLEEITCRTEERNAEVIAVRYKAYDWISKTGYEVLRLRALSFLTEDYVSFGSRLLIWNRGREGLDAFWKEAIPPGRGYTFYFTIASSARAAGDKFAALTLLHEGVYLLENSPHRQLLALVLSHLGVWESEAGHQTEADRAFNEMESLFGNFSKSERQGLWHEAEIMLSHAELIANKPQEALLRLNTLTKGMTVPFLQVSAVERRKLLPALGDAYLATGNLIQASRYYQSAVVQSAKDLRTVRDSSQRSNAEREIESAWKGIVEISLRRQHPASAWKTWERYRGLTRNKKNRGLPILPRGVTVLVYAFLPSGLSAWTIQRSAIHQVWLDENRVKSDMVRFSELVTDPESPFQDVESTAKRLYTLLLAPVGLYIGEDSTLVIDADGPLAGLSWSALIDEQGEFLVERFAISQTSGWPEIDSRHLDLRKPLIIVDPKLSAEETGQYGTLTDARREGLYLQSLLRGSLPITGSDATAEALSRLAPKATLLHFGGHGISYGGFGALLLSPKPDSAQPATIVDAEEIARMKLGKLQLVILAACSSGAGEQFGTVNLDSLVQGFFRAGASRVLAARWNVRSAETADIVEHFYDGLLQKQTPAESLRQAQLSICKNPLRKHPYYWAGLQLFGVP